jgi:hypothetical protein
MSAAGVVSVEDYLHRTEKPYCEYVDGVYRPKARANTLTQARSISRHSCSGDSESKPFLN